MVENYNNKPPEEYFHKYFENKCSILYGSLELEFGSVEIFFEPLKLYYCKACRRNILGSDLICFDNHYCPNCGTIIRTILK